MAAAVFVVVGLVGWRSWNARSAPVVDDALPFLIDAGPQERGVEPSSTPPSGGLPAVAPSDASDGPALVAPGATAAAAAPAPASAQSPDSAIVVHVAGAVRSPGVVELLPGDRMHHAIEAAGGPTADADLDRVNLAAPVHDGERAHIPAIGEDIAPIVVAPAPVAIGASTDSATETARAIDVNRASVTELEQLPGIGPTIARSINDLRSMRGPFASVDELLLVDGIGPAKLEALRPHATVAGVGVPAIAG